MLTLMELKRIGWRPRNICRVLDNHVDISDGCSTNINTPILQYWKCQINAHRWKDEMHLYLFPSLSSIKAASHWFSQTNCLDDYQLSPKRFMIVTVTSVESNALHLTGFKKIMTLISPYNPRPSPVKWGGFNTFLMKFQQQSDCRWIFVISSTTLGKQINHLLINFMWELNLEYGRILMMYSQQWDFKDGLWSNPCDLPIIHLSNFLFS